MMQPFDLETMRIALQYISPDARDVWLQVGQGLKSEFGDVAFDLWDGWSAGSDSYKPQDARAVWRSFRGSGVTIGTVVFLAKQGGWLPAVREISADERKRLAAELQARRDQRAAEIEHDDARRLAMQQAVAACCAEIFDVHCTKIGSSDYLKRKMVGAHGVRFAKYPLLLVVDDEQQSARVVIGSDIKMFFDGLADPRPDHISFRYIKRGTLVIPMRDSSGVLWSIQTITDDGSKMFPKYGRKSGLYHCIGQRSDRAPLLIAEGYATAAALLKSYGAAVAVAFDAGNLGHVAAALREKYPNQRMVICADNDARTPGNPGVTKAREAAQRVGAVLVVPAFPEGVAA